MPGEEPVYVVTDIEADGPRPGEHSMIAFASVAVTASGEPRGEFQAVLEPLAEATRDPDTHAWFLAQPEAWAAATTDPRAAGEVMGEFVAWVRGLEELAVFAAFPVAFDGMWIDFYLRRFTRHALIEGPYARDPLFDGAGLCLKSFAAAVTGQEFRDCRPQSLPAEWLGHHPHTHKAIDDARGYAHLLAVLMRAARR